jgi:hypothetical protein
MKFDRDIPYSRIFFSVPGDFLAGKGGTTNFHNQYSIVKSISPNQRKSRDQRYKIRLNFDGHEYEDDIPCLWLAVHANSENPSIFCF